MVRIVLLLFLVSFGALAQEDEKTLSGAVLIDSTGVAEVLVMNVTQKTATVTDEKGVFVILAQPGDQLKISSLQTGEQNFYLTEQDFAEELYIINLSVNVTLLQEVEVTEYRSINAKSLGIIPEDFRSYTPAEKKLYTARNGLDRILNAISGRTKKLKEALAVEGQLHDMERIQAYFSDAKLHRLRIPETHYRGFLVYLYDNKDFMKAFKSKNSKLIDFLSLDLANKYVKGLKE